MTFSNNCRQRDPTRAERRAGSSSRITDGQPGTRITASRAGGARRRTAEQHRRPLPGAPTAAGAAAWTRPGVPEAGRPAPIPAPATRPADGPRAGPARTRPGPHGPPDGAGKQTAAARTRRPPHSPGRPPPRPRPRPWPPDWAPAPRAPAQHARPLTPLTPESAGTGAHRRPRPGGGEPRGPERGARCTRHPTAQGGPPLGPRQLCWLRGGFRLVHCEVEGQ